MKNGEHTCRPTSQGDIGYPQKGFVYLWALFAVALAGIVMAGTGQVWQVKSQREKEMELLFVGEQFHNAVMSYYESSPGGAKQYPESLEDLLHDRRTPVMKRHLRRIYRDPITNTDEWGLIEEPVQGSGSLTGSNLSKRFIGVHSLSEKKPIKKDKFPEPFVKFSEATTYRGWQFAFKPASQAAPNTQKNAPAKTGAAPAASPFAQPSGQPAQPSQPLQPSQPSQPLIPSGPRTLPLGPAGQ